MTIFVLMVENAICDIAFGFCYSKTLTKNQYEQSTTVPRNDMHCRQTGGWWHVHVYHIRVLSCAAFTQRFARRETERLSLMKLDKTENL